MRKVCGEGAWALPAIQRDLEGEAGAKNLEPLSGQSCEIYAFEYCSSKRTASILIGVGSPRYEMGLGIEYRCDPEHMSVRFQRTIPGAGFTS